MKKTKVNIDKLNREVYLMTQNQPELLDAILEDSGFNPTQLEKNGISKVKSLLFKTQVLLKKQQQKNIYSKAIEIFESAKENTKDSILALLRQSAPQLQFNNLEKMDEQDLKEILNESALLDLMNKIEAKEL